MISTKSGAIGIPEEITGEKLKIVEDNNWIEFANTIVNINSATQTPPAFFEHFYWDNIAKKAAIAIEACK
ncbi:MAG: hypothetical protein IPN43_11725 [Chitinophagaceae bacterium]|nr:hypothetical protein [Chitinophagaceae bacterium]